VVARGKMLRLPSCYEASIDVYADPSPSRCSGQPRVRRVPRSPEDANWNRNSVPQVVRLRRRFVVLVKITNWGCVTVRCSSMAEACEMKHSAPAARLPVMDCQRTLSPVRVPEAPGRRGQVPTWTRHLGYSISFYLRANSGCNPAILSTSAYEKVVRPLS
jgi:hypothetical protein